MSDWPEAAVKIVFIIAVATTMCGVLWSLGH